jgi:UDP-N-acetylmuramate--alanine ligase
MFNNYLVLYNSFYFVGIGGVSMSGLAKLLLSLNKTVDGCDLYDSPYTKELQSFGINVNINKFVPDLTNYQVVVYTDAVNLSHEILVKAKQLNKVIISRGELLYDVSCLYKYTIAIAGCHGKTTTTAMLAHIFKSAAKNFTSHIGGEDKQLSNFYSCGDDYFITEACEYNRNFLYLKPNLSIILNTCPDHLDCYGSPQEVKKAYIQFAENSKSTICLYGDMSGKDMTFGFDSRADVYARNIKDVNGKYSFTVFYLGQKSGVIQLNVYGKHNVLNALAAIAAALKCGIKFEDISAGLSSFEGVKRRFEEVGNINGLKVICDYAHHPDEIKATIRCAGKVCNGRLYIIFQPHTYSRTKYFFKQFVDVLHNQKQLMIYKTFAAREYYDDAGSALTLSRALKRSYYGCNKDDIMQFISSACKDDLIFFLGAGDIYTIACSLLDR